jgi:hypothetical protein
MPVSAVRRRKYSGVPWRQHRYTGLALGLVKFSVVVFALLHAVLALLVAFPVVALEPEDVLAQGDRRALILSAVLHVTGASCVARRVPELWQRLTLLALLCVGNYLYVAFQDVSALPSILLTLSAAVAALIVHCARREIKPPDNTNSVRN